MSKQNLQLFIERIARDPGLQEQLRGCSNPEAMVWRVVELGAGFTAEEVAEVIDEVSAQQEMSFPIDLIPETPAYRTS